METKKVVVEVPRKADEAEVKEVVKKMFSFNVRKYFGKSKNFPRVHIKWRLSA